jgi:hypothetical protein
VTSAAVTNWGRKCQIASDSVLTAELVTVKLITAKLVTR